jgi:hypothetical protein
VFGFVPPTAEPPAKKPILTILKQARAHGVGMVLSTQNPVDLDYKAMSNAGTWMVGRLQTENDKKRILEGIESATGTVDVKKYDKLISDLEKRQFVLTSTRSPEPTLFASRWAMSYLAGPLTRDQVSRLVGHRAAPLTDAPAKDAPATEPPTLPIEKTLPPPPPPPPPMADDQTVPLMPEVAEGVLVAFLDPAAKWAGSVGADPIGTRCEAAVAATVGLLYDDTKAALRHQEIYEAVIFPVTGTVSADSIMDVDYDARDFREKAPAGATYLLPEVRIDTKGFWTELESDLEAHLVAARRLTIFRNAELNLYSRPGETRDAFAGRCAEAAEAAADVALAKLRDRHDDRLVRARAALAKADNRVAELEATASSKQHEELLSGAGDLIGALFGGRKRSNPLGQAAKRRAASQKARSRAETAAESASDERAELADLEEDLAGEIAPLTDEYKTKAESIEEVEIPLDKTDVSVSELRLVWVPRA